jgi:hypothetical protein
MAKLREPVETRALEPLDGDMRTCPRPTTDQQRVRGSENSSHDVDEFWVIYQPVALNPLQRYVERTRRVPQLKFGFAPDVDVSISLLEQALSLLR